MADTKQQHTHGTRRVLIVLIGIFKLMKAALLLLVAAGAIHLLKPGASERIAQWVSQLDVGPRRRELGQFFVDRLLQLHKGELWGVAAGAMAYAATFTTEGIGLLMDKLWAEWLAVVSTVGLIPLEIHHVIDRHSPVGIAALILNIIIAIYVGIIAWRRTRDAKGSGGGTSSQEPAVAENV